MGDIWLSIVITSAVFGLISYKYARHTGRNPRAWAILGIAFNLLALAWICRRRRKC